MDLTVEHTDSWRPVRVRFLVDEFEGLNLKNQKSYSFNTGKAKFEGLDPKAQKSSSDNTRKASKAKFEGLDPHKLINQKSSTVNTTVNTSKASKAKAVIPYSGLTESIYIVGGRKFDSWLSEADCYVPSQDLMKSLSPISSACATSTVKLYGEVMVLGGVKGYGLWYDIVEAYNPFLNKWRRWPSLNKKKGGLAGVKLGTKIFAIGGVDETGELSDVEALDIAGPGDWIKFPSMQDKRYAAAAAKLYGSIYVVGGYNGVRYLESVERYDPRDCRSWTTYAEDLSGSMRAFHSVAVVNEKIYAVGGYDGFSSLSNTDIFEPRMNSWIKGPDMNAQRGCFTMAVLGDTICVMGGQNCFGCITTVEILKDKGGWEVTELEGIGARCFASATVL